MDSNRAGMGKMASRTLCCHVVLIALPAIVPIRAETEVPLKTVKRKALSVLLLRRSLTCKGQKINWIIVSFPREMYWF
jgi:hypothetical protein